MSTCCCGSAAVTERPERTARGYRRFRRRECGKRFNERSAGSLNRTQYPSDVIALVVLWRLRCRPTLQDLSEMFLHRGIVFSSEAVRDREGKLAPVPADELRLQRHGKGGARGRRWHVEETHLKVRGRWVYLYRAIDRDGRLIDTTLTEHRDMAAAHPHRAPPDPSPDRWQPERATPRISGGGALADTTTRTADEALRVTPSGAALHLRPRPDRQPLPPPPRPRRRRRVPRRQDARLRDVGRGERLGATRRAVVGPPPAARGERVPAQTR